VITLRNRISPLIRRLGSENSERRARDEMALEVEGVVNGGVHAEKPLGGASRLEALHFVLSSSHRQMEFSARLFFRSPRSCEQVSRRRRNAEA
jgi:hypothetical protein